MVKIEGRKAHDEECEKKILDKYKTINNKGVCTKCKTRNIRNKLVVLNKGLPVSLFVVGKNFKKQNRRILFVGKTLRDGWEENSEADSYIIYDKNGTPIFIDITKDNHEERSFKGFQHEEDILIQCFKEYDMDEIKGFFKNKKYPNEIILDICEMLNKSGFKNKGKQYDEIATKEYLREFTAEDIKDWLCNDSGKRKSRGSSHPLGKSIRYILECVYGIDHDDDNEVDELWRRTAITNVVKCSVSEDSDETPSDMIEDCINNAGFIKSEIEIIQPTHIVFFTGKDNDYIDAVEKLKFENLHSDQINDKYKKIGVHTGKKIGKKREPEVMWWYKVFFNEKNNVKMHMLVTRHPARATDRWKEEIAEWINYTHKNIHQKSDIKQLKEKYN
jgi:hypothetical protein